MEYSLIVVSWLTVVLSGKILMLADYRILKWMQLPTLTPNLGELCPGQDVVLILKVKQ